MTTAHRLTAGPAVLEVDPQDGGRWTSLAARQAAWALAGGPGAPDWALPVSVAAPGDQSAGAQVRAAYADARDREML